MKRKILLAFVLLFCLNVSFSQADEGMWVLDALNQLPWDVLKQRGLDLKPTDIYNPEGVGIADAVVQLGGGTGTFVSADGLILTNHHVAYGAVQRQSSAQQDFIRQGFLASTKAEEISAKGYQARICTGMKEVTKKVLAGVTDKLSYAERNELIEKNQQKIIKEAETEDYLRADVVDMLSGTNYYLFMYYVIKDIRIVYVPPRSVGEYGGDIDNWMWPRHTGDFSFMRAYVGPDGKPADYADVNVPYQPKKFLKISLQGVKENDFTMVLGYPGNTMRYRTSYSVEVWQHHIFPAQIDQCKTEIKALEELAGENRDLQIKYASRIKGLNNLLKNNLGMVEGLKKSRLLERKQKQESEFKKFLKQNPRFEKEYGYILPEMEKVYAELNTYNAKQTMMGNILGSGRLIRSANFAYRWSIEKEKNEADREPGFSDKNIERTKKAQSEQRDLIDIPSDKKLLAIWLEKATNLPEGQKIEAVENIFKGKSMIERKILIDAFVEDIFSKTIFLDFDKSMELFDKSKEEIKKLNDPLFNFAVALEKENKEIEKKYDSFVGAVYKLRPPLIQAMFEWKKSLLYPDANSTIRFTHGVVKGYEPRDAVKYFWLTSLKGVIEKDTGEEPFDNPAELTALYQKREFGRYEDKTLKDIPVNFLHDTDITGGNSGSAVLNGKGEIIGLVFDGDYESMTSDFQYDPALTRTISVDARYVLFITEKLGKAERVMKELGIAE